MFPCFIIIIRIIVIVIAVIILEGKRGVQLLVAKERIVRGDFNSITAHNRKEGENTNCKKIKSKISKASVQPIQ